MACRSSWTCVPATSPWRKPWCTRNPGRNGPGPWQLVRGLKKNFGALEQGFQPRLAGVARLARVDHGHLAVFRGFHQLRIGAGIHVLDVRLLVAVVGEHLAIELDALVAGRTARCLDVRLVRIAFRLLGS